MLNPPLAAPPTTIYNIAVVGQESVTVPAGTFERYKIEYSVSDTVMKAEWWSPRCPGLCEAGKHGHLCKDADHGSVFLHTGITGR